MVVTMKRRKANDTTPQDVLLEWRRGLGLSQTAAAQMCFPPVTQTAWWAWETGKKPPSLHNAFELQRITGGLIVASSWARSRAPRAAREDAS